MTEVVLLDQKHGGRGNVFVHMQNRDGAGTQKVSQDIQLRLVTKPLHQLDVGHHGY